MTIKAYLFTNMARQINHTYYSLGTNNWSRLYYNLIDYQHEVGRILIRPFVYEVEIKPETILLKGIADSQQLEGAQYIYPGGAEQIFIYQPWKYKTLLEP